MVSSRFFSRTLTSSEVSITLVSTSRIEIILDGRGALLCQRSFDSLSSFVVLDGRSSVGVPYSTEVPYYRVSLNLASPITCNLKANAS